MADTTSKNFQELIKKQIETNAKLQTIIDQNIEDDTLTERALDAFPEIASDRNLYKRRENLDRKEGLFDNDELQEKTREEIEKGNEILLSGIQNAKDRDKVEEEYEKAHLDINARVSEGIISVTEGQKLNQKLTDERDEKLKGLIQPLKESKEDKNDFKRVMKNITGSLKGLKNVTMKAFGFLDSVSMGALSTVGGILKGLFKGGLLLGALILLQKFIDSPAFEKMIEIINKVEKGIRAYIKSFEGLTFEEGATKLKDDIIGVVKKFVKSFATELAIGLGVLVGAIGLMFLGIKKVLGTALRLGTLGFLGKKPPASNVGKTTVKPGDPVRSKSGRMMVAGEDGKPTTQEFKGNKVQKIKKFAGRAGLVGTAITGGLALLDVKDLMKAKEEGDKQAESIAKQSLTSTGGALGGAAVGAAVGSFVPIVGTGIGAIVGGIIGGLLGDLGGDKLFKTDLQTNKEISEKNQKLQEDAEAKTKKLDLMLEKGTITNEEHLKRSKDISLEAAEQMKKNNRGLILETQKNSLKQTEKSNEMIALLEENNKLLTTNKDSSPTFLNANNTNVQNNPSEQTIVMDSQIVDGFHSQVLRNQYG
mgnify:CR=1 FL=1|tara:strand:- start:915 stop:2687 length:1773 start_codon:yes stop_codon:yes gene_type:complete